jgi:hypothetical protein
MASRRNQSRGMCCRGTVVGASVKPNGEPPRDLLQVLPFLAWEQAQASLKNGVLLRADAVGERVKPFQVVGQPLMLGQ